MVRSWKQEFDSKYNKLMNSGEMALMDKANVVLTKAISGLDKLLPKPKTSKRKRK